MPTVTSKNREEFNAKEMAKKESPKAEITEGESLVGKHGTKYQTKGGHIDVKHSDMKYAPRKQSIVDFVVDESKRGQGIGSRLLKHAMSKHDDIGAQVSSPASVKVFYNHGFRHPEMPDASFEEHEARRKEESSVFMAHKDLEGKPYVK